MRKTFFHALKERSISPLIGVCVFLCSKALQIIMQLHFYANGDLFILSNDPDHDLVGFTFTRSRLQKFSSFFIGLKCTRHNNTSDDNLRIRDDQQEEMKVLFPGNFLNFSGQLCIYCTFPENRNSLLNFPDRSRN